ncbi:MAG: Do family serine endopeptidase [Pyrinomonadaceae bacterium]
MSKSAGQASSIIEQKTLRKIYLLLLALTVCAVGIGAGVGFLISERTAVAEVSPNLKAPEAMSNSFAEVAKEVEPAVVNIDTKGKIPEVSIKNDKPTTGTPDDILEYFKRQLPRRPSYAVGSGFIVDKAGYILTNFHVVEDSSRITVKLQGGEEYAAKIIGTDEETDLAVLKIEAGKDLPSVKLGDSNQTQVGDWVLAIGSPFGLEQTVTAGIISKTNRETPYPNVNGFPNKFIQTDAAINRGNSGGPLVNMDGEVIGINSQIATTTGDYNGIGFAVPSSEAAYVYQQILQNGKVRRGYLGVSLDSVKPEFAKVYNLPEAKGAIITNLLDRQSPAGRAGLQVNDIIVEFNGEKVENAQDLIMKVSSTAPEKQITLAFLRETNNKLERLTTNLKIGERPPVNQPDDEEPARKFGGQKEAQTQPLGLTVGDLTPPLAASLKLENQKGVLVKDIDPASFIADLKNANGMDLINENDLIQRVNRVTVADAKTFNEIIGKLKVGDAVVMHIARYSPRAKNVQQRIVQFTVQ